MAHADKNSNWVQALPLTLMSIRSAVKEDLGVSSAQIIYGEAIRVPGAFFPMKSQPCFASQEYLRDLQKYMTDTQYISPRWHKQEKHKC